jgi:hypothetical protein
MIVKHYTIELQTYHDEIVGRVCFTRDDGTRDESALYSISELNNIVQCWRVGGLLGSFAIGATLAPDACCTLAARYFKGAGA